MRKRGYKTELDLNNEQITACLKHAGCARKAYNWGLARKEEARAAGLSVPNARTLHRELNTLKATEFPYMYEFRRQMEYKARDAGCLVQVVSRWEPSSQTCSGCGWRHPNLTLADRVFICQACGLTIDRDFNAAQNLAVLA